jgi:hypothetical protein
MKISNVVALCLVLTATGTHAQNAGGTGQTDPPATAPQVTDIGPNHSVSQWQTFEQMANGTFATHTHSYTTVSSGLNYQDPTTGQWTPAHETIESFSGGAIVRHCQHQIIFANDLNSPGAIDMQTPDKKRLRSNILALLYSDPTTGQTEQIGQLQDSEGELIGDNEVLYPNAFQGVAADVLYKNRIDGMEQNVIIKQQLPTPESVGMISATTYLVVLTELIAPPEASVTDLELATQGEDHDQAVSWGTMSLGRGKAFILGTEDNPAKVTKRYMTVGGRYFLQERVRLQDIQQALSQLPTQASNARPLPGMASTHFKFPKAPATKTAARPIRLASGSMPDKGYVLDYTSLNSAYTNYTFQGGMTYYVSGTLNLAGMNNIFEGGSVIKYTANASINFVSGSAVTFASKSYHPTVFTAKDDNTVGETITGSTGNPNGYYANPALNCTYLPNQILANFRISWAQLGIVLPYDYFTTINDAQFVSCAESMNGGEVTVNIENALFSGVLTNFGVAGTTIIGANITFANSTYLAVSAYPNVLYPIALTNCIFANVTSLSNSFCYQLTGDHNGFYNSPSFGTMQVTNPCYPFQRVGAGSYYLTNGCGFFASGTSAAGTGVLSQLSVRTTHPPLVLSNLSFYVSTNFSPQAQRDTNSSPDLGYHYDPLDWVFSGVNTYSNMTFSAGTAMGWFELPGSGGTGYGISIFDRVILSFTGTATQPCIMARYSTVQEGGTGLWQDKGYLAGVIAQSLSGGYSMNPANAAQTRLTFTRSTAMAGDPNLYRELNALSQVFGLNSEFDSGGIGTYWDNLFCTNCLFYQTGVGTGGGSAWQYWLRNCTMHGGSLTLAKSGNPWPVWIEECAFDGTTISVDDNSGGNTNITYCAYNAYLNGANRLPQPSSHDVIVTNFNWQSSWFGNFYLPPNSQLIDHGSTTADKFGLYQFTTQTNQMKETNSIVDIGYHFVATDTYGNPMDSNGDGIPDYLEDTNGNGTGPWMQGPPWIINQPASVSLIQGSNATFGVTASGSAPLSYQWYFNNTNLLRGATNATIVLTNVQPTNTGNYSVFVSNLAGLAISSNGLLTLLIPVTITTQPANVSVACGSNAVFNVIVTGSAPISYQWYFNGIGIAAATNSSLTVRAAQTTNMGYYSVIVANFAGSVTSTNAYLTVLAPPVITVQPKAQTVLTGTNVTFSVTATGTAPLSFQWYFNGTTPLSGAQISTVLVTNSIITTFAGNGSTEHTGDGGPAVCAGLNWPAGVAEDSYGNVFIADMGNNVIRKVAVNGVITTVAGNGQPGYQGDGGQATNAEFNQTWGVAVDPAGNLYIVDGNNNVVRKVVNTSGIITTIAGNGQAGPATSGVQATNASLNEPNNVALDQAGNLYISDYENDVIRKVGTNGIITTVAGNGQWITLGPGDGGQATNASLNGPSCVVVGPDGSLYIADTGNNVVRKVATNGIISTVAGATNRTAGYKGEGDGGQATNALLNMPGCVYVDPAGRLFIGDENYNVIREVNTNGIITTVAGNGSSGYSGDGGAATNATLNGPWSIWGDGAGRLFIGDGNNNVIREVAPVVTVVSTTCTLTLTNVMTNSAGSYSVTVGNGVGSVVSSNALLAVLVPPSITTQPTSATVIQGGSATFSVTAAGTTPLGYQWYFNGTNLLVGATNFTLTITNIQITNTGNYFVVVSNVIGGVTSTNVSLTVLVPPAITTQPTNVTVIQGSNATFSVTAAGTTPLNYQWYSNGTNQLIGATNASLTVSNVQTNNAGNYSVTVVNPAGSVVSSNATLTVLSWTVDSDYDGRSDAQEILDGTDPFNPNSVLAVQLAYFPLDDTNVWTGSAGQLPLLATNIVGIPSWSTNAVLFDSTNPAILCYRDVETNGVANINLRHGTVCFWFWPDWSSASAGGSGPGDYGRLIEMGSNNPVLLNTNSLVAGFTNGWWALYFSPDGTELSFGGSTNGFGRINLSANIAWASNQWHQIVLTYTSTNSSLYLDGQLATNGLASSYYPNLVERSAGFRLGSDQNGTNQARGAFDELETFNYPLSTANIATNYQFESSWASAGNSLTNLLQMNQTFFNAGSMTFSNGIKLFIFEPKPFSQIP